MGGICGWVALSLVLESPLGAGCSAAAISSMGVLGGLGVLVGCGVGVAVDVEVAVGLGVGVWVGVAVGVAVGVWVSVGVDVGSTVTVEVVVAVGVLVGTRVGVGMGLTNWAWQPKASDRISSRSCQTLGRSHLGGWCEDGLRGAWRMMFIIYITPKKLGRCVA